MSELELYAGYDALHPVCLIEETPTTIVEFSSEQELKEAILSATGDVYWQNLLHRKLSAEKR